MADERGFTLVELLVALLCTGILASLALSALLGQRFKASDAVAKGLANTARQTASNYGLAGSYTGMTPAALKTLEPQINTTVNGQAVLATAAPTANGYILSVVSSNANTFTITNVNGLDARTCAVASGNGNTTTNTGGGCNSGKW
jgi:prepilin-type N-terminal cleavage/methylation domain-containing protein